MKIKLVILIFLLVQTANYTYSNSLKNIDQLTSFERTTNLISENSKIILLGITTHQQPQAIFNYNDTIKILKLNEFLEELELIEIGNAKVVLQSKERKKLEIYLGEETIQLTLDKITTTNTNLSAVSKNTLNTPSKKIPEFQQANEQVSKFLTNSEISTFETKIIEELTQEPGLSNAGRVGWVMPESILGHPIEKIHLQPGDLVLNVNGIPVNQLKKIYEMYKDNSIKKISIELKRDDSLIMLDIVRP
jgi:C-terminal processing protease CtpA/Prc